MAEEIARLINAFVSTSNEYLLPVLASEQLLDELRSKGWIYQRHVSHDKNTKSHSIPPIAYFAKHYKSAISYTSARKTLAKC
jgi:hypothetical protein